MRSIVSNVDSLLTRRPAILIFEMVCGISSTFEQCLKEEKKLLVDEDTEDQTRLVKVANAAMQGMMIATVNSTILGVC